jgi:poly-beta-1,6-N-acetyl-D-glucosamine synthase
MKLLVVTPVRDECTYIQQIIADVKNQHHKPDLWVIVDDGSTDSTYTVASEAIKDLAWIKLIKKSDRGFRLRGPGVVAAFNFGLQYATAMNVTQDFDLISKLDVDISIPHNYFELIIDAFESNSLLGISSGAIYEQDKNSEWRPDQVLPLDFVRGQCKVYRKKCFDSIEGLYPTKGWDGIDNIKAIIKGWDVYRLDSLIVKHFRHIGQKDDFRIAGAYQSGRGFYYMGSDPKFFMYRLVRHAKSVYHTIESICMLYGYLESMILKRERISEAEVICYIREKERALLFNKEFSW